MIIKKNIKKTHFSSNLFKNIDFFKILKTDDIYYLAKFVKQYFLQKHISMHQKVQ
jgi:hypothetical protein